MVDAVALSVGNAEPIGDWTTLVAAIREWSDRTESDFSNAQIAEFIAVCEARLNRLLRVPEMETVTTLTVTSGNVDLPSDFLAVRALYLSDRELRSMTPAAMIARYGTVAGCPMAYALVGSNPRKVRFGPQPGSDDTATLIYYARLENVSEANADNWLLNDHPDIYLYGTLLAASAFIADETWIPMWKAAYDEAIGELISAGERDRHGGAPLVAGSSPAPVRGVRI